jgi:hypothetical protein
MVKGCRPDGSPGRHFRYYQYLAAGITQPMLSFIFIPLDNSIIEDYRLIENKECSDGG